MDERVRRHFGRKASEFDRIYAGEKSWAGRLIDRTFRWDMMKRFERTLEECGDVAGKSILDIGCGSGRFMKALSERNPELILGVDFAPEMIGAARRLIEPSSSCRFVTGDFMAIDFGRMFDIALAVGFFDYIHDARPFMNKIRAVVRDKMIATFPRKETPRAAIRRFRLTLHSCPVYFYSGADVERLLKEAGFIAAKIETFGQLIFIVAK